MDVSWVIFLAGLGTLMPWIFLVLLEEVNVVHMAWSCIVLTGCAWLGYATHVDPCLRAAQPVACVAASLVAAVVVGCLWFDRMRADEIED
jgi:hypothetical protein